MTLNSRHLLSALLLAALALWISFQQTSHTARPIDSALQQSGYSWQLFNSTAWQYTTDTPQRLTITQAQSVFYDDSRKLANFNQPHLILIEPQQTLTLQSQSGQSLEERLFDFKGEVIARQYTTAPNRVQPAKTLQSEVFTFDTQTQLLQSDLTVTLTHEQGVTTGTGLRADLKNHHIQLLSNVRGDYNPQ